MAKKSTMNKTTDAVKTVAARALGAAAAAATQVVVETVVGAVNKGGKKLDAARPKLEKSAADAVSKPILPTPKRKSARAKVKVPVRKPKRRAAAAKKKGAAKKKHP
jgi:hypothetical protein